ncbi:MAG TPA: hypothetical protein VN872_05800, partial [Candidatus Acidoferrum sp.]|nr:hypothetical protein [Candidatus Acidoferrum sp.]
GSCSVSGSTVHISGAGSCTITASQAGDANNNPASDVPQLFSISKASQTITFGALASKTFSNPDFAVSATASSSLAVSFVASGNCSVSGSTVHISGAGSCTITASQAGDANNNPATDVPQSFLISKANQTITFGTLPAKNFGDPDFAVSATASSSLAVGFAAGGACSVTGSVVHLTGAGLCTITASQPGDSNFNSAASVPQSFLINPGDDFAILPMLPSITVTAGQSGTQHVTITPNPATLTALTFICSGLPAKASCSFTPNPVSPGSAPTDVVMTITTTASTTAALERPRTLYAAWLGFGSLGLVGVVLMGGRKKGRRKAGILGFLGMAVVLLAIGCGGRSAQPPTTVPGTPQGTSVITVTGSTAGFTHSTTFTLTVN